MSSSNQLNNNSGDSHEKSSESRSSSRQSQHFTSEVKVPVLKRETSVLENEYSSVRERFDDEMKRMEDEMNKLRGEIMEGNQRLESAFKESRTTTTKASSSKTSSTDTKGETSNQYRSELQSWLNGLESPLIQDKSSEGGDGRTLRLRFEVAEYKPEEISVKTVDNKLKVHAKHEEKTDTKSVYKEYNREFLLPAGTNAELIKSTLSRDGVLTVEAPLPALPAPDEKMIPITYR